MSRHRAFLIRGRPLLGTFAFFLKLSFWSGCFQGFVVVVVVIVRKGAFHRKVPTHSFPAADRHRGQQLLGAGQLPTEGAPRKKVNWGTDKVTGGINRTPRYSSRRRGNEASCCVAGGGLLPDTAHREKVDKDLHVDLSIVQASE